MNSCAVSIVIPAYRQPELLRRCLQSVASQSFRDFEVVITDDSPDNAVERVAREFEGQFPVRYFRNPARLGSPENWNEAVRHARGELVKILHHDDWFSGEHSLRQFVELLRANPDAGLGFCHTMCCSGATGRQRLHAPPPAWVEAVNHDPAELFFGNLIGAPSTTIFRRSDFLPFSGKLLWLVDVEFYLRMIQARPRLALCAEPLVCVSEEVESQITNLCVGNPAIEVYEWVWLYSLLSHRPKGRARRLRHLLSLLEGMGISSPAALKPYLKELSAPRPLVLAMKLRSFASRAKHRLKASLQRLAPVAWLRASRQARARERAFQAEFTAFKQASEKSGARLPVTWEARFPCLEDRTPDTAFDGHYVLHTAWAARVISQTRPAEHIDISSSLYFSAIVSAFVPVRFYDYRPARLGLSNLSSSCADLHRLPFPDQSVQSISCMHVVEHVGLGRYGDPLDPEGDLKSIAELKRVLAPGGSLLFVVPVGTPMVRFNAHRIYSHAQIMECFSDLSLVEFALIPDDFIQHGLISNATQSQADAQAYGCGCFWFKRAAAPNHDRP